MGPRSGGHDGKGARWGTLIKASAAAEVGTCWGWRDGTNVRPPRGRPGLKPTDNTAIVYRTTGFASLRETQNMAMIRLFLSAWAEERADI